MWLLWQADQGTELRQITKGAFGRLCGTQPTLRALQSLQLLLGDSAQGEEEAEFSRN